MIKRKKSGGRLNTKNTLQILNEALNRYITEETEEEREQVRQKINALDLEVRRIREAEAGQPGRTKIFTKFKRVRDGKYIARLHGLTANKLSDYMDWIEEAAEKLDIKVDFQDNIQIKDTYSHDYSSSGKVKYNLDVIIFAE